MDKTKLEKQVHRYVPAILLNAVFSVKARRRLRLTLGLLVLLSVVILALSHGLVHGEPRAQGLFLIFSALWIALWLLEFFYRSYYFLAFGKGTGASNDPSQAGVTFEAAELFYNAGHTDDPVKVFVNSYAGGWIMARCGISKKSCLDFLAKRTNAKNIHYEALLSEAISADVAMPSKTNVTGVPADQWGVREYLLPLLNIDGEFLQFLLEAGLEKDDVINSAGWFDNYIRTVALKIQWWSKRELARIPGLAKDWAYGKTFVLDRYSREIGDDGNVIFDEVDFEEDEVRDIEVALANAHRTNLLLVGEKDQAFILITRLVRKIKDGTCYPELEHKRVVLLEIVSLISSTKEKAHFEHEFIVAMNEAVKAGNIILIIENFPSAISDAHSVGSDLTELLDPYLVGGGVQVVAIANTAQFHQTLESEQDLMSRFEKILVKEPEGRSLRHIVEREALRIEAKQSVFFTFPAIRTIAESAERYFGDASPAERTMDLLSEIVARCRQMKNPLITKADVLDLVGRKTGIPLGEVKGPETDKLLNLESLLHERVIGQSEAISAISSALRRARSGINSPNRPIGSFLFMGPTGVGKTETAKALAFEFFDSEEHMLRIDMTEYQGAGSLTRIMGILAGMLRDHQYGVLLLDEFEKASSEAHDLFLQILDEGFFSDKDGKKVNARNTIIIATSNAGSDMIWKAVSSGADLQSKKEEITDEIISQGIFKPELLNRFDGVIFFHPLSRDDLAAVAKLMLAKLSKRLQAKGMDIVVTPELVAKLVEIGSDPKYGGRSMNRAITEHIEEAVARKIISHEAKAGSKITIDPSEIV